MGTYACYAPQLGAVTYEAVGGCDPTLGACDVRAQVRATFRGNHLNQSASPVYPGSPVWLTWSGASGFVGSCGQGGTAIWDDIGDAWIQGANFSCADPEAMTNGGMYTLRVRVCQGATFCTRSDETVPVPFMPDDVAGALCPPAPPPPKPWGCGEEDGCETACMGPGGGPGGAGGGGSSAAGGGAAAGPAASGPGAMLRYQAGGVAHPGAFRPTDWVATLGRYWSHDYAEHIVVDPNPSRVWLLTRWATYRRFDDLDLDGVYETSVPSDEYRRLSYDAASGWTLRALDGTTHRYDLDGQWIETADRHGNAKTAQYDASGRLERVDFPDGRREDFGYDATGKLTTIIEVGVDGQPQRTWTYAWTGNDLTRIDRPDGTVWRFDYADPAHPGFMTRMTLEGSDGVSERIEGAWDYVAGNVVRTWRGAEAFDDPSAVDAWSFAFDDAASPTVTTVTDPLGNLSTYTFGRDPSSSKPRIAQVAGDCPTCGLAPNTQRTYADPAHPLRATREVDGRGLVTLMTHDASGRIASRSDAVGTPDERTTTWRYDATFPALIDRVEQPSTSGNAFDRRIATTQYSATGEPLTQTIEGVEDGQSFAYTTTRTYTAEGQLATVDGPDHGTADVVTWAYDPQRGGLVMASRIDPLIGVTTYGHDALNRRTSEIDPNGVRIDTEYDALDRVRFVRHRGATPAEDLVTEYRYDPLGDLVMTVLPAGNVMTYAHDAAGRVVTIERRPDDQPGSRGERIVHDYDPYGHKTSARRERWDGSGWVLDAETTWQYSTRCHLDRTIEGAVSGLLSVTEYAYDCNGNLERVWDANHPSLGQTQPATTEYLYDSLDRVTTVRQPFGGAGGGVVETSYAYDVQDHVIRITDGEGTVTRYVYSDRDLLTEEISEVAGTTHHAYTPNGELASSTDARGVTVLRSFDALDRVTLVDYPDDALDIAYTYDDPQVPFSAGRLTQIARDGSAIDYGYDRFGRVTQDGALQMTHDRNGNRRTVTYPGGFVATYGFDFADRASSVSMAPSSGSAQTIVSAASYRASGLARAVTLGNGLIETREHDGRDHPTAIRVPGLLDWTYATDAVGNPTSIVDGLSASNDRTYAYQDVQYHLTQGDGPWGTRSWSYDRLGNRLSEVRDGGAADVYGYLMNAAGGN
ncbi:MAG: hypothetical protein AAF772_14155, partial [Acidobacteriota bacterium]